MSVGLLPFSFRHATRRVIFEPGGLVKHVATLAEEHGCRAGILVVDPHFATTAAMPCLRDALASALQAPPSVFVTADREPDTDVVEACRAAMQAADPDLIVAIGGGSAMDAAKVARLLLANPGTVEDIAGFDRPVRPHRSLLICAPTTAGTGSEVSEMAVIAKAGSDVKLRYRSADLAAQIALLDPALTLSMPRAVTVNTGFDAFTHAVESFVSRASCHLTDALAIDAVQRLAQWLPVAASSPRDIVARGHCLVASLHGAMAFNTTMLGMAHAIAAPLGALHHLPHGLANALALPAVAAFNEPAVGAKADEIARALRAGSMASGIARFRREIGLDRGLDEFVADDAARLRIARAALKSGNMKTNPREADLDDVLEVIEAMRRPTGEERPALRVAR